MLKTKEVMGLRIVNESFSNWVSFLQEQLKQKTTTIIMTPNPEQLMIAKKDVNFYKNLQRADSLIPDGAGLVWTAKLKERITGVDSVVEILKIAKMEKLKVLLVGGHFDDLAKRTQAGWQILSEPLTQSEIYYTEGYQNIAKIHSNESKEVQLLINELKPDIVLIAFGAPKQEKWLIDNQELLKKNKVRMAMVVGGTFDFLLGKIKRAPKSWQKWRLEWLWRLIQEPWRWKRQLMLIQYIWYFYILKKPLIK